MTKRLSLILLDTVLIGLGTWLLGWWAVPLIAGIVGFRDRGESGRAGQVALAASLAWTVLILIDLLAGPFGRLTSMLGGAMGVPGAAVLALTILFPAILAWSAAAVGGSLHRGGGPG